MVKFIKPGKVAILLKGRYAGKKAVVVKNYDEGTNDRNYAYAIVAGCEHGPLKITRVMTEKAKIIKRSKIKPFVKIVNYSHMMPTRYVFDLSDKIKNAASMTNLADPSLREEAKKAIKKAFQERHRKGENKWFFNKLRF
ncbi:hypothetical protein INT47_010597 [Mucor saturninus]|uniref:60S ribosomal protein L27 n=1 Tax=Mucor saturninus TaxID=64648 RepID=A0A8H7UYW3_9FUNG|nr:hypothetical protein INT47_010597 [Mucor saturninus]